eukprot:TRINITY_DN2721_c0_g1_i1.p1 TRINITY_DN2721_c0_g1~~TRINITY_DN2721_c0_g1_i1.p1  ORF type:complete len:699 (+),score=181.26 TRINITY_DN2721_c0_g1_i1:58-2154(+)
MTDLIMTISDDESDQLIPVKKTQGRQATTSDTNDDDLGFTMPTTNTKAKAKKVSAEDFFDDLMANARKGTRSPWNFASAREAALTFKPETYTPTTIEHKIQQKKRKAQDIEDEEDEEDEEQEENGPDDEEENDPNASDEEGDDEEENDGDDDDEEEEEGDEEVDDGSEEEQEAQSTSVVSKQKNTPATRTEEESDDEDSDVGEKVEFAPNPLQGSVHKTFQDLNLSKPFLKAIEELSYASPTPIQSSAIPVILLGRDVCGSARTGSGKTAAFLLPILERLVHRNKRIAATRVLILLPTRELAAQCHSVCENLARFTDIRSCLIVGGLSSKVQESQLKTRPDIIVATPGRVLDHARNTLSFSLEDLEILVLDEADRLLEMGFIDEIEQIVKECPKTRQTVLFSATMTEQVDSLAKMSLKNPVRVSVDAGKELVSTLTQEFVRVRSSDEEEREAMLIALCQRTYKTKTIVFFQEKKQCHRARILFGLFGLKTAELHGNLTQQQRLDALELFRDEKVDFLLSTDLAARGLDILGIQTVINFDMPRTITNYIHRVGRTARAGRGGVAVSLIGEGQRAILKKILKMARNQVKQRTVDAEVVNKAKARIVSLAPDIQDILDQEREEKQLRMAEVELKKAENMVKFDEEIRSRPAKTWFASEREKRAAKERSKAEADKSSDEEEGDKKKGKKVRVCPSLWSDWLQ